MRHRARVSPPSPSSAPEPAPADGRARTTLNHDGRASRQPSGDRAGGPSGAGVAGRPAGGPGRPGLTDGRGSLARAVVGLAGPPGAEVLPARSLAAGGAALRTAGAGCLHPVYLDRALDFALCRPAEWVRIVYMFFGAGTEVER